jgi:hypothetical protein
MIGDRRHRLRSSAGDHPRHELAGLLAPDQKVERMEPEQSAAPTISKEDDVTKDAAANEPRVHLGRQNFCRAMPSPLGSMLFCSSDRALIVADLSRSQI